MGRVFFRSFYLDTLVGRLGSKNRSLISNDVIRHAI